jgi:hypothetical protein
VEKQKAEEASPPLVELASNGRSTASLPKNGKPAGSKPTNGKTANGKPANGKSNGNGAAARIVALKIVDGVPIHSDHDLIGHAAGHAVGNGNGHGAGNGNGVLKRRNGAANGKNGAHGTNGNGSNGAEAAATPRPDSPIMHLDMPSLKHDLLRRPARPPDGVVARKTNGKAGKKI